jgi:hypothetical protein
VAGQAEAARMGQPLTVYQQQVWLLRQLMQRLKDRRCFPEGQQAGHIGKAKGALNSRAFN